MLDCQYLKRFESLLIFHYDFLNFKSSAKILSQLYIFLFTSRCLFPLYRYFTDFVVSFKLKFIFNLAKCDLKLTLSQQINALTAPRYFSESTKNVVSALHDGDSGPFVVTFGMEGLSLKAISRSSHQKLTFAVLLRQPTAQHASMYFSRQNDWFFEILRSFRHQLVQYTLDLVERSFLRKFV